MTSSEQAGFNGRGKVFLGSQLESALARLKEKEALPWAKVQVWGHGWLTRLERRAWAHRSGAGNGASQALVVRAESSIDLSRFLGFSFFVHLLFVLWLSQMTFVPAAGSKPAPVFIRFVETQEPASKATRSAVRSSSEASPPRPRMQSPAEAVAEPQAVAENPALLLPQPKALAELPSERMSSFKARAAEQLLQPARPSDPGRSADEPKVDAISVAASGAPALPEKLRRGEGAELQRQPGPPGPAALSSSDFSAYLETIKQKVQAAWKYPEGISGQHKVDVLFILDRAGKLVRVEVLDSTDSRLNASCLTAMRTASPFPPIPDSLIKGLAGSSLPLRIKFSIGLGVKTG